jgi:hypothetical protein
MANAGAVFDNDIPEMSERESGAIDMSETPETPSVDPTSIDMLAQSVGDPKDHLNDSPISFDETGAMVEREDAEPEPEPEPMGDPDQGSEPPMQVDPIADTGEPDYLKTLAESQQQMAEYLTLQQRLKDQEAREQELARQRQAEQYYSSADYVTQLCERSGMDAEDPIHRQLVEQRLQAQRQNHEYNQRIQQLEQRFQEQATTQARQSRMSTLQTEFSDAASQYKGAPQEIVEAAQEQAQLLVDQGLTPQRAVAESIKFVRLAAKQPAEPKVSQSSKRQERLDKVNSLGPGRGAKSHRRTQISIADADALVEKYGFLPN